MSLPVLYQGLATVVQHPGSDCDECSCFCFYQTQCWSQRPKIFLQTIFSWLERNVHFTWNSLSVFDKLFIHSGAFSRNLNVLPFNKFSIFLIQQKSCHQSFFVHCMPIVKTKTSLQSLILLNVIIV